MAAKLAEPTPTDLVLAILKHVRTQEGLPAARGVAMEMLAGLVAILCVEFGPAVLSEMLATAEACAHVATAENGLRLN